MEDSYLFQHYFIIFETLWTLHEHTVTQAHSDLDKGMKAAIEYLLSVLFIN